MYHYLLAARLIQKTSQKPLTTINEATSNSTIIEVITQNMEFNVPTKIPSGWTTFEYKNNSSEVHFFVLEKLPEGITIEEYKNELIPPFRDAYTLMNEGKITDGLKEFDKIPPGIQMLYFLEEWAYYLHIILAQQPYTCHQENMPWNATFE